MALSMNRRDRVALLATVEGLRSPMMQLAMHASNPHAATEENLSNTFAWLDSEYTRAIERGADDRIHCDTQNLMVILAAACRRAGFYAQQRSDDASRGEQTAWDRVREESMRMVHQLEAVGLTIRTLHPDA